MGRRFLWRVAWFMAAAFLLIAVILTIGAGLVGTAVGLIHAHPPVRILAVASLLLFVVLVIRASRRFRRMAVNVGDLVDAAGRIEAGGYGGQAAESGPREARTPSPAFNPIRARLAPSGSNTPAVSAAPTPHFPTPPTL